MRALLFWLIVAVSLLAGPRVWGAGQMDEFMARPHEERCKQLGNIYAWGAMARSENYDQGVKDARQRQGDEDSGAIWVNGWDLLDEDIRAMWKPLIELGWTHADEQIAADVAELEARSGPGWEGKINVPADVYKLYKEFVVICLNEDPGRRVDSGRFVLTQGQATPPGMPLRARIWQIYNCLHNMTIWADQCQDTQAACEAVVATKLEECIQVKCTGLTDKELGL